MKVINKDILILKLEKVIEDLKNNEDLFVLDNECNFVILSEQNYNDLKKKAYENE
jgi:PHD/YefM family antitoxin component YafN of YafNO toxin-antitoxin module